MNKNFLFILQLFCSALIIAQNPALKVYIDKKEFNKTNGSVSAWVKVGSSLHSILNADGKTITPPPEINYGQIEGLKFVVEKDTIFFSVAKLLEPEAGQTAAKSKAEELNRIFRGISRWDLHIDHFKYFSEKEFLDDVKEGQKRTSVYSHYIIYALRTTNFRYYVVKT